VGDVKCRKELLEEDRRRRGRKREEWKMEEV